MEETQMSKEKVTDQDKRKYYKVLEWKKYA